MNLFGKHSKKEVTVTLCIWGTLLVLACGALVILRNNAVEIIEHIHYVNVKRGEKAAVLYAEAENHARQVLLASKDLNLDSSKKMTIPANNEDLQKSLALFNEAIKIDPRPEFSPERILYYELLGQVYDAAGNRPAQLLANARAFMSQDNTADALDYIRQAREISPESGEPLLLLAQLRDKNRNTTAALAALNELYSSHTVTAKAHWLKGVLMSKTGKSDAAVQDFAEAVHMEPNNLSYRGDLGVALADAGNLPKAVDTMQAGLEHGGWLDAAYLHVYGNYLTKVNDLEEAIRVLMQADELAPYSGDVQWSLARAYHKAGKTRQANSALSRAIQVKPELRDQIF